MWMDRSVLAPHRLARPWKETLMVTDLDALDSLRRRLGPVGVWLGPVASAPTPFEQDAVRRIEALGYGSIWAGEVLAGKEAFAHQGLLLAATERIITGTGIANVWARQPGSMQGGAATLGSAWPGRFILGIGISHAPMVERSGLTYEKPLTHMARYIEAMDASAADAPHTDIPVARVLAALRPQMLALARDHADGAHPYFVPTAHTGRARETLGPGKLLIPEQAVVLSTDPVEARGIARHHMVRYLQLPNYVGNLRHLGYSAEDVAGAGSDRLVDDIVAWGDEAAIAARVRDHLDRGADHVLLQALGDPESALANLQRLAPAVLS
jgi:probable F420-dependent oxidoreductase